MFSAPCFGLLMKIGLLILELLLVSGGEGFGLAFETGVSETPFGESSLDSSFVLDTLARVVGIAKCWRFEALPSILGTSFFMDLCGMKGFLVRIKKVMKLDQLNHENFLPMIVRKSLEGGWGI